VIRSSVPLTGFITSPANPFKVPLPAPVIPSYYAPVIGLETTPAIPDQVDLPSEANPWPTPLRNPTGFYLIMATSLSMI